MNIPGDFRWTLLEFTVFSTMEISGPRDDAVMLFMRYRLCPPVGIERSAIRGGAQLFGSVE